MSLDPTSRKPHHHPNEVPGDPAVQEHVMDAGSEKSSNLEKTPSQDIFYLDSGVPTKSLKNRVEEVLAKDVPKLNSAVRATRAFGPPAPKSSAPHHKDPKHKH